MEPAIKKKHILIVDDSADIQLLLKLLFESRGYIVKCTSNGREALDILVSREFVPDLIMLDVHMPIMDGYAFRNIQCKTDGLKHLPVIVMSAVDDMALYIEMKEPYKIIQKPLSVVSVLSAVQ